MLKIITSFDSENKKQDTTETKSLNNKFSDLVPKPINRESDHNLTKLNESE